MVIVDRSGTRGSAYCFAAGKVILVAGYQKIVKNLDSCFRRIREYVFPLESERAKKVYGIQSGFGKWMIFENEFIKDRTTLILVKKELGF